MTRNIVKVSKIMAGAPRLFCYLTSEEEKLKRYLLQLETARARGYLKKNELRKIAQLKSPRRAKLIGNNSAADIKTVTTIAFGNSIKSELIRIGLLTALDGVEVPTASAIMSWIFPDRYGVIDQRAWRSLVALDLYSPAKSRSDKTSFSARDWARYLATIRELASRCKRNPQQIDLWLYHYDMPQFRCTIQSGPAA